MKEARITINKLDMNAETAIRIAVCLKKHEPEIWKVFSVKLKQYLEKKDVNDLCCCLTTLAFREMEQGNEVCSKCNKPF